jgi:hypothetical protein
MRCEQLDGPDRRWMEGEKEVRMTVQDRQPRGSECTSIAMRDRIVRVTGGRIMHWVSVHDIAHHLGLDNEVVDAAVRRAIEEGWLIGDSYPPHSVRLAMSSMRQLS